MVQSAKRFLFALWVKCRLCGSHRCRSAVLRQIEHLLALGGPGSTREFKPLDTLTLEQMKDACPDGPEASHTYSIAMLEGGQQAVDSLLALDLHVRFVATIAFQSAPSANAIQMLDDIGYVEVGSNLLWNYEITAQTKYGPLARSYQTIAKPLQGRTCMRFSADMLGMPVSAPPFDILPCVNILDSSKLYFNVHYHQNSSSFPSEEEHWRHVSGEINKVFSSVSVSWI